MSEKMKLKKNAQDSKIKNPKHAWEHECKERRRRLLNKKDCKWTCMGKRIWRLQIQKACQHETERQRVTRLNEERHSIAERRRSDLNVQEGMALRYDFSNFEEMTYFRIWIKVAPIVLQKISITRKKESVVTMEKQTYLKYHKHWFWKAHQH